MHTLLQEKKVQHFLNVPITQILCYTLLCQIRKMILKGEKL